MKTLVLARHAKSSWRNMELSDIDRPLKARGVSNAYAMGEALNGAAIFPDLILTSPAARALHTATIYARKVDFPMERIQINDSVYAASAADILDVVQHVDNQIETVMVVGHNPTFTNLINSISDGEIDNLPTSGIGIIEFDMERWSLLGTEKGVLRKFISPKMLVD